MISIPRIVPVRLAATLAVATLLAGWIARGLVNPVAEGASIVVFGDWRVTCPARAQADKNCNASQDLIDPKTGSSVVRVTVSADEKDPSIDVLVPHNVLLPKGLGLKIGSSEFKPYPYRTCNDAGCVTTIRPAADLYRSVLRSHEIDISFADLSGRPIVRKMSDTGYSQAVSAMRDAESKRHSWIRRVLW